MTDYLPKSRELKLPAASCRVSIRCAFSSFSPLLVFAFLMPRARLFGQQPVEKPASLLLRSQKCRVRDQKGAEHLPDRVFSNYCAKEMLVNIGRLGKRGNVSSPLSVASCIYIFK
ncbi:MAG: hypothetical protein DRH17_01080 [Deltaproteobacteria bacterium]|nr:MAG: hypothetical protein DRH17_01080 [Deltaproteobacteria bacterium]